MNQMTTDAKKKVIGRRVVEDFINEINLGFSVAVKINAHKQEIDNAVAINPTASGEFVRIR